MKTKENIRKKHTVMLFGEILADEFPGQSVLGGAPYNVGRHLAAFGLDAVMVSRVGADPLGEEILRDMRARGMETRGVQRDGSRPTGRVRVIMEEAGHRFDILPHQAYDYIAPDEALDAAEASEPELVYFGTLSQRHAASARTLDALLESTPVPRFVDINLRAPWYDRDCLRRTLERATMLKINSEELRILADLFVPGGSSDEADVRALMDRFGTGRIIVTCAGEGAWQICGKGRAHAVPGGPLRIADTVGAGDGFAAVCILGIIRGWPEDLALTRANAFARAVCTLRGAVPAEKSFYNEFLEDWGL